MSTFNSAGNGVFSLCKNTDNQYCYDCKKNAAFTGKERDGETGYSYFGARYYDSDLSGLFLSVDPMSDKYPSISPYAYCAWNPVKLVDPDGEDWYDVDKKGYIKKNVEKSKEYTNEDVLYSQKTGELSRGFNRGVISSVSNSVTQEYEFIENDETIKGSASGTQIDVTSNENDAKDIYDFLIKNTDHIEFSMIQANKDGTEWYITTSHSNENDEFSTAVGYALSMAGRFYSHQHNHPYNNITSNQPSEGDITFMNRTTALSKKVNGKSFSPIYKLATIFNGQVKNMTFDEQKGIYR